MLFSQCHADPELNSGCPPSGFSIRFDLRLSKKKRRLKVKQKTNQAVRLLARLSSNKAQ